MKNDTQIQQEVIAELDQDQQVTNGSIGVEVHHGVVKLAGCVKDDDVKRNAELAAKRVDGVSQVILDMDITKR